MIRELSLIIPTLNEATDLPLLLKSLTQQTYKGKLQVIIVDGNSTDKTVEVAKSFKGQLPDLLVLKAKKDIGLQRNIGAQQARYKYLLFIDADVLLPLQTLEQLCTKINMSGPFVVGVMHKFENMSITDRLFYGFGYVFLLILLGFRLPVTIGDFMLTTHENHQKIGGFTEGAILGEDVDYGKRSVKAGATFRFYFKPKVIGSARRAQEMGRMRLLMLWVPSFLRVYRHGPIFPGQGLDDYPFGHYNQE